MDTVVGPIQGQLENLLVLYSSLRFHFYLPHEVKKKKEKVILICIKTKKKEFDLTTSFQNAVRTRREDFKKRPV